MVNAKKNFPLLLGALIACATIGCDRDPVDPDDVKPFDLVDPLEGDLGQGGGEDMGAPEDLSPPVEDMSSDLGGGGEDLGGGGEDMGEPDLGPERLREVVDRPLFGEMNLENRVKDPRFDTLNAAYAWFATVSQQSFQSRTIYRKVFAQTPAQAPVLHVPKNGEGSAQVYGEVLLRRVPMEFSVWIGRNGVSLQGEGPEPTISVYGVDTNNPRNFAGVQLTADSPDELVLGQMRWRRYSASASQLAGYGYFVIADASHRDLYVHAPQAVFTPVGANAIVGALQQPKQAGDAEQRMLLKLYERVRRERSRHTPNERPVPHPF